MLMADLEEEREEPDIKAMLMADLEERDFKREIAYLKQQNANLHVALDESSRKLADLEERYIQDIKIPEEQNLLRVTRDELKKEEETETTGEMDDKERQDTFTQMTNEKPSTVSRKLGIPASSLSFFLFFRN